MYLFFLLIFFYCFKVLYICKSYLCGRLVSISCAVTKHQPAVSFFIICKPEDYLKQYCPYIVCLAVLKFNIPVNNFTVVRMDVPGDHIRPCHK